MEVGKVSIIVPVYNTEKYLEQCIQSLLDQTYRNIELIIIDDCSTDKSYEILRHFAAKDARVKLYRNKTNMKLIYTLNRGLDLADGKYIARMDSDDISKPTRIEKQVKFLEKNKQFVICGTWIEYIGNMKGKWRMPSKYEEIKSNLFFKNQFAHPSIMFRGSFLKQNNIKYNSDFVDAEDWELWNSISKSWAVSNVNKVLVKYRVNEGSVSIRNNSSQVNTCISILKNNIKELGIKDEDIDERILKFIFTEDKDKLNKYFIQVNRLACKLKENNEKTNTYAKKYFNRSLNKIIFKSFIGERKLTLKELNNYLNNYSIDFIHSYEIYIKEYIKNILF